MPHSMNGPWFLHDTALVLDLADALQRSGENEAARVYMDRVRAQVDQLKRNGARRGYQVTEARLSILEGKPAAAIALLREERDWGGLRWYEIQGPLFDRLSEEPEFIALKADLDAHINDERAKLGWQPAAF